MLKESLIMLRKKHAGGTSAEIKEDQSLLKGKEKVWNLRQTVTWKKAEMANPCIKMFMPSQLFGDNYPKKSFYPMKLVKKWISEVELKVAINLCM